MTRARLLLLVPAVTYRAADFLLAASRLGLDLLIGSDGALPIGDRRVVRVDPDDLERSVDRLVSDSGVLDAVVAVDTSMLATAAAVAARMGLQHNSPRSVTAAMDKAEQRRAWAVAGVAQPAFRVVHAGAAAEASSASAEVGFPCVVKPVSLSGSRGVLRVDDEASAVRAACRIWRILAEAGRPDDEPLLVEEYLSGPEVSVDGLLDDGALTVTAVFDKPDAGDGPTFEETLLVAPSKLPETMLQAAVDTVGQAARVLGLRHGPIHAELRVRQRGGDRVPAMLELAARSIGGLCSRALGFEGGMSLEEMVLANALGRAVAPPRLRQPSGVLMLHPESDGILEAVKGVAAAASVPGVTDLSITIPVGQQVRRLPEGDRYLGFVFASGDTRKVVMSALRAAREHLDVIIG